MGRFNKRKSPLSNPRMIRKMCMDCGSDVRVSATGIQHCHICGSNRLSRLNNPDWPPSYIWI